MGKTGRNDPCPCGSGKKYKFCCGKGDNIIPFPGLGMSDEPFEGTKLVESTELADIRREFGAVIEEDNNAPVDDFLGLSPLQMHNILSLTFGENSSIVRFTPVLKSDDTDGIPFMRQALFFLTELQKEQPLPATKNGNLPRKFVQLIFPEIVKDHPVYQSLKPQKESDMIEIERLRHVLDYAGLIKKYRGAFSLTKAGSTMLAAKDWGGIYGKIFQAFSFKYLWAYEDGYPDLWIIQHALIFDLYLLKQMAGTYVSPNNLGLAFARAFPVALEEATGFREPVETLASCFELRFLERYAIPMGFVESSSEKYKLTPLFARVFDWQV